MNQSQPKHKKQYLHEANLTKIDTCISFVENLMSRANNLACLSHFSNSDLTGKLVDILGMIARTIQKLRQFIGVKEHTTIRAIDRAKHWSGSSDWRQNKFAQSIARMKYELNQALECVQSFLSNSDRIGKVSLIKKTETGSLTYYNKCVSINFLPRHQKQKLLCS